MRCTEMTKDEIKKGLEFCKAGWCVMCPYCNCIGCEGFLKQDALTLITEQEKEIDRLKAENKQLKTECTLLDDELRIARQETIDVLNKLKTKAFDKDAFNGWAGSTFVVLVRDIDKMIEDYVK
nr:MAG TPA: cell division protein [Caudoviricetes sp.]